MSFYFSIRLILGEAFMDVTVDSDCERVDQWAKLLRMYGNQARHFCEDPFTPLIGVAGQLNSIKTLFYTTRIHYVFAILVAYPRYKIPQLNRR